MQFDLFAPSGKTSPESSAQMTTRSAVSWAALSGLVRSSILQTESGRTQVWFLDPKDQRVGASLMPNISAWPNDASVCSLSSVLETDPIPQKYFLSGKACAGIIRRAEKRGKKLPERLARALQAVVDSELTSTSGGGCSLTLLGKSNSSHAADKETYIPVAIPILEPTARQGKSSEGGVGVGDNGDPMFTLQAGKQHGVFASTGEISHCLNAGGMGRIDYETETLVTHTLRGEGFDASEDGTGRGVPLVPVMRDIREVGVFTCADCEKLFAAYGDFSPSPRADLDGFMLLAGNCPSCGGNDSGFITYYSEFGGPIAFSCKDHGADAVEGISPTLRAMTHGLTHANAGGQVAIVFDTTQITSKANRSNPKPGDPCRPLAATAHPPALEFQSSQSGVREVDTHATLDSNNGSRRHNGIFHGDAVRRLTPKECHRLQGFPDGYLQLTPATADGPQYKALGNSMAVPNIQYIGKRIMKAINNA